MTTPMSCSISTIVVLKALIDVADEAAELHLFVRIHSRHRLIEQEEFRRGHERAGEFDPLLESVGQGPDDSVAIGRDLKKMEDLVGPRAERAALGAVTPDAQGDLQKGAAAKPRQARQHIVDHAHAMKERVVLEGASDAALRSRHRGWPLKRLAVEHDLA